MYDKRTDAKILLGVRYHFSDICKLAMFAGISVEELTAIPDTVKDSLRKPVYQQVAEELQVDYDLVCKIGEAVLKRYERKERIDSETEKDICMGEDGCGECCRM